MFVNSIQQSTAIYLLKKGRGKLKATEKHNIVQESQKLKWRMITYVPVTLFQMVWHFPDTYKVCLYSERRIIFQESSTTEEQQLKPEVNKQNQLNSLQFKRTPLQKDVSRKQSHTPNTSK